MNRGSRTVYWRPVEEAVAERLNRDSAIEAWLTSVGLDYVLIVLGRPGLQLFRAGRVAKFDDGGGCFELEITDEIANSTDLDEVQDFLIANAIDGLAKIARKLGLTPPSIQVPGDPAPAAPRGRVADIAMKEGSGLPLLLISPRHSQRSSFGPLKDALAGGEREVGNGWAAYVVGPEVPTGVVDIEPVYDFTGIERPFDPDVLLRDPRNVIMLIASAERPLSAQRTQLAASLALVNDHIAMRASVSGNDSGVLWTAGGVDSSRSRT